PRLKFVSVESGIGWIPFMLQMLDYMYGEMSQGNALQRQPSEYFKTNIYACFWFERKDIGDTVRKVGVDNVMFETDFPHPTCLYPVERSSFAMPELTADERRKVLSGNAARVYNIALG